ncbi:YddF family protein [Anaerospora hongkongensis]|uniref:YddF family protein n=1 Tax=Anaerospora hongkongensis TaxID=244830 RepID=UPI00289631F4|nr:YddF family protein [Anaerospora hongkongensis]
MENRKPIAILNGAIITAEGDYSCHTIKLEEAKELIRSAPGIISAVGHQATAEVLTDLLETEVTLNRINFYQEPGQQALVFKLNSRPPEGVILSREEIEEFGYQFQVLSRKA